MKNEKISPIPESKFITLPEFCEMTGLKPSYVYRLTSSKQIRHYKPFGKKVYFKLDEVNLLFEDSRVNSTSDLEADAINYVFDPKK